MSIISSTKSLHPFHWFLTRVFVDPTNGFLLCGAILIGPNTLLSAAHCNFGINDEAYINSTRTGEGIPRTFLEIVDHPDFETSPEGANTWDFRLVRLNEPIDNLPFSPDLILNEDDEFPDTQGTVLTVIGQGSSSQIEPPTLDTNFADVPFFPNDVCQPIYSELPVPPTLDPETMLCAGLPGVDSCFGDSGGPLVLQNNFVGIHTLVGVSSFGTCGGTPGVYARVSAAIPFIRDTACDWENNNFPFCPSEPPSTQPSETPSQQPSSGPSLTPSEQPSSGPSLTPSEQPSSGPSEQPSFGPSAIPSEQPSFGPSAIPSLQPSSTSSEQPTLSNRPSIGTPRPSAVPTLSIEPSLIPSGSPTLSTGPSLSPSGSPTISEKPSDVTDYPTFSPFAPSASPSISFSPSVSNAPSQSLSPSASFTPSQAPSVGQSFSKSAKSSKSSKSSSSKGSKSSKSSSTIKKTKKNDTRSTSTSKGTKSR